MRHHLVTVTAAAIAATAVSFALAQADQPARSSAATDRQILGELRQLNRSIGETRYRGLRKEIPASIEAEIGRQTEVLSGRIGQSCRAIAELSYQCPSGVVPLP